jgi:ABC-type antimicrobial peptide transport system permease subunit
MSFQGDPDLSPEFEVFVVSRRSARARQLLVRTDSREPMVNLEIRRLLQRTVGPTFGIVQDWGAHHERTVSAQRFVAGLFGLFGAFALSLTAVGLYSVLSYAVGQRRREFGVRLALGAQTTDLVRLVLHDGLVMILAGTALGAGIAMWGSHLLRAWLYSVAPTDAAALVAAELTLILVALAACIAPAIQATRANPLEVMRAV